MNLDQDTEQLRLLSIFHYVVAGFTALLSMLPIVHMAMGIAIVTGALEFQNGNEPPEFFGWMFIIFPAYLSCAELQWRYVLQSQAGDSHTPEAIRIAWSWRVSSVSLCRLVPFWAYSPLSY